MKILSICRSTIVKGPSQKDIPFKKGRHYAFEGYVKLLNDSAGKLWQTIKAAIQMRLPEKSK